MRAVNAGKAVNIVNVVNVVNIATTFFRFPHESVQTHDIHDRRTSHY